MARAGPQAPERPADLAFPGLDRQDRVRDSKRKILVSVIPDPGFVADLLNQRLEPSLSLLHEQRARRVGDIGTLASRVHHDASLRGEDLWCGAVSHHQEPDRFHPELATNGEVLYRRSEEHTSELQSP